MTITTSAGMMFYIGTTAADPTNDTYTEIGEITDCGEFGRTYEEVKVKPMSSRGTYKVKGGYDDGDITLSLSEDLNDAGQQAANTALNDDHNYNFRIEYNDKATANGHGTRRQFKGKVMSFTTNPGGRDSVIGSKIKISIDGDISRTAAT